MVTGVDDADSVKKARDLGADDYITKPLVLQYLESNVMQKISELTKAA
jgi:PleD family two-component response regulator